MNAKIVLAGFLTLIAGVFVYTRPHNIVPSDLRDAVGDGGFDTSIPVFEKNSRNIPEPVARIQRQPPEIGEHVNSLPEPRISLLMSFEQMIKKNPVWPGYSVLAQPIMVYRKGERSFLLEHPTPPQDYSMIAVSPYSVAMKEGTTQMDVTFKFHFLINGVDSFAYMYKPGPNSDSPKSIAHDAGLIVHERFHVFQEKDFKDIPGHLPAERYEPSGKVLAMAILEQRALAAAVTAEDQNESAFFARLFVAIRKNRNSEGLADTNNENLEEQSEGTAQYVEINFLARMPGDNGRALKDLLQFMELCTDIDSLGKTRFYATGAIQSILLDRHGQASWKSSVASGIPTADLLMALYPMSDAERQGLVDKAKARFDYVKLLEIGNAATAEYTAEKEKALADYNSLGGIELEVPDRGGPVGMTNWYPLDNGDTLYPSIHYKEINDAQLKLRIENRPAISGRRGFRFHVGVHAQFLLDGQPFELSNGTYPFASLEVHEPGADMVVSVPGTIGVRDDKARIELSGI